MKRSLPPLSPPFLACRHSRAPGAPSPAQHGAEDLSSCSSPLYLRQDPSVSLLGSPCLSLPCAVAVPPPGTLSGWLGQQGMWRQVLQEMRMEICPQLHPQLLGMEQVPAHKHHLQFRHFPVTSSTCGPRPSTSWAGDTFSVPWALCSSSRGASPPRWPLHSRQTSLGGFR